MKIKKVRITIRSLKEANKEARKFAHDFDSGIFTEHTPTIGFADFVIYKKFLSEKRLELLGIIKSKKPKSIKDLASIARRDFKNVYEDLKMLKTFDLVKFKKTKSGIVPTVVYDEIDLDIKIPIEMISR